MKTRPSNRSRETKHNRAPSKSSPESLPELDTAVRKAFETPAEQSPSSFETTASPQVKVTETPEDPRVATRENEPLPARMLNEFVYCPRLFYYEQVEGIFVHNADTIRGRSVHRRVDKGGGELPVADSEPEKIHARSVQLASDRLGVVAKLDLVESHTDPEDLFSTKEVCPVEYKSGAPRPDEEGAAQIWDADRMQLGLQCLLLRDNGYQCGSGILYYRETRQRVRLEVTKELETWIMDKIAEARRAAEGPIPEPLVDSPKCPRCSLAPVCLPDETRWMAEPSEHKSDGSSPDQPPRRLIAPRDEQRALYLNTPGLYVSRKGELLVIKEKDKVLEEIRLHDVCQVSLFGRVSLSGPALQALCEAEIPVGYFSMGGRFYGMTRGLGLKNVLTRIAQFQAATKPSECLALAKGFVMGKISNQRTQLMRNHAALPDGVRGPMKELIRQCANATNLSTLLGVEGAAASIYFGNFQGLIKPDPDAPEPTDDFAFQFEKRNRRPPRDPVNACLSLAYSMLSRDCTFAAAQVGLDPFVGFFHQPRHGRPALALDVMEEFRPLIADSTVCTAINNRMLKPEHFVRAGQSVNLSAAGRKIFFQVYERRLNTLIQHPLFDYKVSYRRALELQMRILAKYLTGEIPAYQPFLTR